MSNVDRDYATYAKKIGASGQFLVSLKKEGQRWKHVGYGDYPRSDLFDISLLGAPIYHWLGARYVISF